MKHKPWSDADIELAFRLDREGLNSFQIAKTIGRSPSGVRGVLLREHGDERRARGQRDREAEDEEILELYRRLGWIHHVAESLGVGHKRVREVVESAHWDQPSMSAGKWDANGELLRLPLEKPAERCGFPGHKYDHGFLARKRRALKQAKRIREGLSPNEWVEKGLARSVKKGKVKVYPVPPDPVTTAGKTFAEVNDFNECMWPIGVGPDRVQRFCGCRQDRRELDASDANHTRPRYCLDHALLSISEEEKIGGKIVRQREIWLKEREELLKAKKPVVAVLPPRFREAAE